MKQSRSEKQSKSLLFLFPFCMHNFCTKEFLQSEKTLLENIGFQGGFLFEKGEEGAARHDIAPSFGGFGRPERGGDRETFPAGP